MGSARWHIKDGECSLVFRKGNAFKSFPSLNQSLLRELWAGSAVLDGEIVCLDEDGRPDFKDLLFRRGEPRFYAFDLLFCEGEELRYLPLLERKNRLRSIIPTRGQRLLYCDHLVENGESLFELACENDLEGIVAKHKYSPYLPDHATWFKIRNPNYSQWVGREEFFERKRSISPDLDGWDTCVGACAQAALADIASC